MFSVSFPTPLLFP